MLRRNALQSVGWNRGNPCQLLSQPGGGDAVVIAASESYSSFLDKCTHGFFRWDTRSLAQYQEIERRLVEAAAALPLWSAPTIPG